LLREFQALNGITDLEDDERPAHFRLWPILLQKSFCSTEHKFSGPWVRLSKNYVGDYFIVR
jgi:hypothetical protein